MKKKNSQLLPPRRNLAGKDTNQAQWCFTSGKVLSNYLYHLSDGMPRASRKVSDEVILEKAEGQLHGLRKAADYCASRCAGRLSSDTAVVTLCQCVNPDHN